MTMRNDFYRSIRRMGERQRNVETGEMRIQTSTANVGNPPTAALLTSNFGLVEGTIVAVDTNDTGNYFLCVVIDGVWVNFTGVAAP